MSYKVNGKQCSTCIFGKRSPVSPERFAQLKAAWEAEDIVQECHHATIKHRAIGCRGYYAAALRGEIANDPITAIAAKMGLAAMRREQYFGFFESVGFIEFVEVEE